MWDADKRNILRTPIKKDWTFSFFNRRPTLIYDIGTEILCKTCFGHNSTQNERKSTIFGRIFTEFHVHSESGIKIRFKDFSKNDLLGFAADLSYNIYFVYNIIPIAMIHSRDTEP